MFRKCALTVFLCFIANFVWANPWIVERTTAGASYSLDGQNWSQIRNEIEIPNTSWIHTSKSARVQLRRDAERIVIQPDSLAAITTWEENGQKTRVDQRLGVIFLDVETRARQHTFVNTPHLAAVVKGTAFEVSVSATGSTVRVERGEVAVSQRGSDRSVPVGPGQSATVQSRESVAAGQAAQTSTARNAATAKSATASGVGVRSGENRPDKTRSNGKGNAGNNGNGNAGNNGNDNAGNNGNGNAGNAGNGNAGNNGNGNGNAGNAGNGNPGNGSGGNNGNAGNNSGGNNGNGNAGNDGGANNGNGNAGNNSGGNNGNGNAGNNSGGNNGNGNAGNNSGGNGNGNAGSNGNAGKNGK
ncbi:FecR domain-containing protein [Loktanella sp. M215]|uniref:FecR domain-containing protein n=1 Tax=Loktanella sp. M215 TaxID=2675431 RepID=UPI001F3F520F|nr:FecR domain-containing protein [Loktanella sp. M215]